MAFNDDIEVLAGTWTQMGDAAASAIRVQELDGVTMRLQATSSDTAPTDADGGVYLRGFQTLAGDLALADLFPGIGSGDLYLWAYSTQRTRVSVSHA